MLNRLTERIWWTACDHETDRPTLGYIRGDRHALLVDCGASPAHIAEMLESIRQAGLPAPTIAAVTHAHWDHVFGMCALDIPIVAGRAVQRQLSAMQAWAWTEDAMLRRLETGEDILFCHEHMLKEYANPLDIRVRCADIVFDGQMTLDLGGCTVQLPEVVNSHADGCTLIYSPEERVLFTGDATYMDLHAQPPCWHMKRRKALIRTLEGLPFHHAVPGHQEPLTREAFFADLAEALQEDADAGVPLLDD